MALIETSCGQSDLAVSATNGESEAAKVTAAINILDRGWGRPSQPHDAKVEGDINITIRNILEGKK